MDWSRGPLSSHSPYNPNRPVNAGCSKIGDANYDFWATDLSTCSGSTPVVISGCMDKAFAEYNDKATKDDGSCKTPVGIIRFNRNVSIIQGDYEITLRNLRGIKNTSLNGNASIYNDLLKLQTIVSPAVYLIQINSKGQSFNSTFVAK